MLNVSAPPARYKMASALYGWPVSARGNDTSASLCVCAESFVQVQRKLHSLQTDFEQPGPHIARLSLTLKSGNPATASVGLLHHTCSSRWPNSLC
jgi:hypothetical protein